MVPNSACLLPTLVTGDLIDFDIVFTSFGGEQSLPVQEKKTVSFVTVKGAIDTVLLLITLAAYRCPVQAPVLHLPGDLRTKQVLM